MSYRSKGAVSYQELLKMTPREINVMTERMTDIHIEEERAMNPDKNIETNR